MRPTPGVLLAIAGDVLVLIGYAAAGRAGHGERRGSALVEAVVVAVPFIAGWLIIAAPL